MICFYDSFQLPDKAVFFPLSILNRKQRRHCDRILFARVCNFSYFDKVICYRGMFVGFFAIHKLLDIFYSCVKSNVFILIMVRSAKVTAIVVKTCVMSHIDANLLLIVGSIPIINYIKINYWFWPYMTDFINVFILVLIFTWNHYNYKKPEINWSTDLWFVHINHIQLILIQTVMN